MATETKTKSVGGDSKMKAGLIWFNGQMVPQEEAKVSVLTHALHYGTSIFEGLRAYNTPQGPAIFRLQEHTERFFHSAKVMMFELPFSPEQINQAIQEVVRANGYTSCYIRPLAWMGAHTLGVNPLPNNPAEVMIAAWEWGTYLGEEAVRKGARLITSSWARFPANVMPGKAKVGGNYVNSALARVEAQQAGADEALLLDKEGFVAEGSGENIFFIRHGVLYAVEHSVNLMGITRDSVITIARDLGYEVREVRATRDQLYMADEVFMVGTAAEVTPVSYLDHRAIGTGKAGEHTMKIRAAYMDVVHGKNPKYAAWLTYVK
ncbi:branched-chain amino acid transaminase [Meiothermus ruber]|jgi:branched-chain amino acid aminotransferase|uniref:Branched-chain-amino-acid aminotransferase n=1 Tax=Meiothermus ruber (strain ATCC 35948 / DSM 1279 / VKM B-1258 / 21) TaxID=504728 RepID=D3PQA5_MEIRD|nr:branched-chain amino acid transaminase [Meiothermus ruber]GIW30407.1 MAG: branched chain amino acid aminotransferase [Meiothermus sp.]ADD29738.1 branched-chain amino acid aminotransferase [Meiothermus ruber DSM 1279]AGK04806.1 branched-chain amino acid aminotransferase [Meiothermus ruber DSM 1279]MCL6529561.1 branched-chain amino acid transaminase [Meiothermus ruber]MCX7803051.1 branched-chain amino acid transaminase [Meiothermus ruber]